MLKRKIDEYLRSWKESRETALLVDGARQVGKSFSIENFANNNFKNVIEINFAVRTDLIDPFVNIENPDQFLIRLSDLYGDKLVKGETLIFLDEVQLLYNRREELKKLNQLKPSTQDILTTIKPLVQDGKYRYILSGSLLSISIKNVVLYPVGYLEIYKMYPLDFEEYLWAKGVGKKSFEYLQERFEKKEPVDEYTNQLFLDYFREYVIIGGMPKAVDEFLNTKNLYNVQITQEQIIQVYKKDITNYIEDDSKKLRVLEIYNAIPSELNSKNMRFVSRHAVDGQYLKRNDLVDEYLWLTTAGIAIPTYNVTNAEIPLTLTSQRKTLKLFTNDIGLLTTMLFSTGIREKLLDKEKVVNYGAPYENAVAQELWAHGYDGSLFYFNSKKRGEVDFLVEKNQKVLPIEVKSGKPNETSYYDHAVLNNLIELHDIKEAYVFGDCNYKKETDVIHQFPIYMIMFLYSK